MMRGIDLLLKLTLVTALAIIVYAQAIQDHYYTECRYQDMDACKLIYEKEGLTGLSKAVSK